MGPSSYIDPHLVQQGLTEPEYLLRKEFARLFCKTHNAFKACIELGFAEPYAIDWAKSLMADCVVRQLIREQQEYLATEEGLKEVKLEVINKLREQGDYYGPGASHGARVAAWTNIGKFVGLEVDAKPEEVNVHKGGVMVVPALTSADDWGLTAATSQALLKQSVKD